MTATPPNHPHELPVYGRWPARLERGDGVYVWDEDGRRFLDLYGGHAVAVTGHGHPHVVEAIERQARTLVFYSNVVPLAIRERLFDALTRLLPEELAHIFLVNSGGEANEQAIGLARRITGRSRVITVDGGFHGRTLVTLAASGIPHYRRLAEEHGFPGRTLVAESPICPFDDVEALDALIDNETAALILEPVQGMAGARAFSDEFLHKAREWTHDRGALLLFDEVQCGTGRCGAFSAAQSYGIVPDILTMAKGIGGGIPIGAVFVAEAISNAVSRGDLGTTFGGGPIAAAAALANLEVIEREDLPANAARLFGRVQEDLGNVPGIRRVQGRGLLIGLVLDRPAEPVRSALFDEGILVGTSNQPNVLRMMPPLTITDEEFDPLFEAIRKVLATS